MRAYLCYLALQGKRREKNSNQRYHGAVYTVTSGNALKDGSRTYCYLSIAAHICKAVSLRERLVE